MAYVIFSKRQQQIQDENPDMYQYESIPNKLRVQVRHIWEKVWKKAYYNDCGELQLSRLAYDAYNSIDMTLREEYGVLSLNGDDDPDEDGYSFYSAVHKFLLKTENTYKVIDVIEVSFRYIDQEVRDEFYVPDDDGLDEIFGPRHRDIPPDGIPPDDAIDQLNQRFREHGVGYQYESGQIVKMDSPDSHSEVVKPAEELSNNTQQAVNNSPMNNDYGTHTIADNTAGREILTEGYPIMRIDITGYVTATHGDKKFTIKVTSDNVPDRSLSNLQVAKEATIEIKPYLYPFDDKFIELTQQDDPRINEINKCLSLSDALREGDQIECSVFIVDPKTRAIDRNPNNIETYAKFPHLWLYPDNDYFRRSESDSRESLKFRQLGLYEELPSNTQQPTNQDTTDNEDKKYFIGHGGSPEWLKLRDFLENTLGLEYEEFNRIPQAGRITSIRLKEMLESCCMAFLIMTGEDEHADGTLHARSNVIHEIGLFQAQLGYERAIILREEGCEIFSNIQGITYIPFPKADIEAAFEKIRGVLKRESMI